MHGQRHSARLAKGTDKKNMSASLGVPGANTSNTIQKKHTKASSQDTTSRGSGSHVHPKTPSQGTRSANHVFDVVTRSTGLVQPSSSSELDNSIFESDTPGSISGTVVSDVVAKARASKPPAKGRFGHVSSSFESQPSHEGAVRSLKRKSTSQSSCFETHSTYENSRIDSSNFQSQSGATNSKGDSKRFAYIRNQQKDLRYQSPSHRKKKTVMHTSSYGKFPSGSNSHPSKNNGKSMSTIKSPKPAVRERTMTLIKDVSPMNVNMAIKGRCISVWHSHKFHEEHDPYSLDCVFQDEESNRIQIYVKKEFMFKFEPLLREGQCYIISNFGVAENAGRLPLLPNQWRISFYKGTEVTRIDHIDDNFVGFVNEPFSSILDTDNEYHEHDCVDIVGTVVAIGKIVTLTNSGGPKLRRTIVVEDAESLRIDCTFWDNWALMWNDYDNKRDELCHIDILLMLGKVKYWDNKPSIHNALFSTRIFINRDVPQLLDFRKRYEEQEGYDAGEFRIEDHSVGSRVVTPAEFMHGCVKQIVRTIRSIEPESHCVVYAEVHSIQEENGWVYTGCKSCSTRVTPIVSKRNSGARNKKQLWYCKNHGETYTVASRFKIIVRIFDHSGTAQVVIFDKSVHKMTNLTAWEIMESEGMNTEEYFPDALNQIIGRKYLFKILFSEFNHNNNSYIYRAEKVTDDVDIINYFKNGFIEEEDDDEEDESLENNSVCSDDGSETHSDDISEEPTNEDVVETIGATDDIPAVCVGATNATLIQIDDVGKRTTDNVNSVPATLDDETPANDVNNQEEQEDN